MPKSTERWQGKHRGQGARRSRWWPGRRSETDRRHGGHVKGFGERRCEFDGTKCIYSHCALGKPLPHCALGFASSVTGGAAGHYHMVHIVTRSNDYTRGETQIPGTLRCGVDFARKFGVGGLGLGLPSEETCTLS